MKSCFFLFTIALFPFSIWKGNIPDQIHEHRLLAFSMRETCFYQPKHFNKSSQWSTEVWKYVQSNQLGCLIENFNLKKSMQNRCCAWTFFQTYRTGIPLPVVPILPVLIRRSVLGVDVCFLGILSVIRHFTFYYCPTL